LNDEGVVLSPEDENKREKVIRELKKGFSGMNGFNRSSWSKVLVRDENKRERR